MFSTVKNQTLYAEDYKTFIHLMIWSLYQAMPITMAIYYASKTTEYVSTKFPQLITNFTNQIQFKGKTNAIYCCKSD